MFGIDDNLLIGAGVGLAIGGVTGYMIGSKIATKQPKISERKLTAEEAEQAIVMKALANKVLNDPESLGLTKEDIKKASEEVKKSSENKTEEKKDDKPSEEKKN